MSKKKPINKKRVLFIFCCCVIPVIHWLIFYVYANLSSFAMAFTNKDGMFTLGNFTRFWDELHTSGSELGLAFRNTFLTFGIQLVMFPFGVLVSYFIYKKVPGYGLWRVLFFLPGIIFSVALTLIIKRILGVQGFIAEGIQNYLDLSYRPEVLADSRFANTTVLLHMIWMSIPGDLIIWGGTFARIPIDVLESARIDGVNWWKEFTRIIVPLVWPTVALKMVLTVCGIFGASGAVFLLTNGNYDTMTFSAWMYLKLYDVSVSPEASNAFNYMSAVGMAVSAIAITISLLVRRWTDKAFDEVEF